MKKCGWKIANDTMQMAKNLWGEVNLQCFLKALFVNNQAILWNVGREKSNTLSCFFSITKQRIGERYILYELHYIKCNCCAKLSVQFLTVNRTLNNQTQVAFCFLKSGMFFEHKYLWFCSGKYKFVAIRSVSLWLHLPAKIVSRILFELCGREWVG